MVLSILIATITAPGLLGSQEAIRQSQSKDKREEHRARRCNLIATCVKSSKRSREIDGRAVVLKDGKLWIDTGTEDGSPLGHPYAGYYLPYPDSKYEGLVTTITDEAPIMNWVYIDRETHQVRYGVRDEAQPNLTGPFDCTRQDRRLTFEGWEGWCAVEEAPGSWALYYDVDDNGLSSKVAPGMKVLELELSRKEKRFKREKEARQQDQSTKRAVDTEMEAPVDTPLAAEVLVSRPGVVDAQAEEGSAKPESYKPLKIPKSIFEDPPPIVAPLVFRPRTPKTPPPAYSPAACKDSFPTEVVPKHDQPGQQVEGEDTVSPAPIEPSENTRPTASKLPVASTVPSTTGPATEKHIVRKRSSGTKALAQAQMFEALAAGRELKPDEWNKDALQSPVDRIAVGYTSSEYSNDGKALEGKVPSKPQPQIEVEAASRVDPLLTMAKTEDERLNIKRSLEEILHSKPDAEVIAMPHDLSSSTISPVKDEESNVKQSVGENLWSNGKLSVDENLKSKPSTHSYAMKKALKTPDVRQTEALPTPEETSKPIDVPAVSSRIPDTPRKPGQARFEHVPRQPSQVVTRSAQQMPSRIPPPRQDSTLQRKRSSSEMLQPTLSRSPSKAVARTIRDPARTTLARAMTTGTRNQGMANRLTERRDEPRPSRGRSATMQSSSSSSSRGILEKKQTSAMLRDIDELVSQDEKGPVDIDGSGRPRGNSVRRTITDDEGKVKWK